jgi:oligopeptide/dipeptide ABC transporter ATP-binding protein
MPSLLKICDLRLDYLAPSGCKRIHALNGVNLEVHSGEAIGVLGESGSGKSTVAKAVIRLLPKRAEFVSGRIEFEGRNLKQLTEREMDEIRGARIAIIPQEASLALNPVMKIGDQIVEILRAHRDWSGKRRRDEAEGLLDRVQLRSASRRMYEVYPHQLSGGQQQRVAIALALACEPALVIADEPTASLDPEAENEILQLLRALRSERAISLLLITHDPQILEGLADRVVVMYAGRVVEDAPLLKVFCEPRHPYTKALLACSVVRQLSAFTPGTTKLLATIDGSAPDPTLTVLGCSFAPRCRARFDRCDSQLPSNISTQDARHVECFLYGG